MSEAEAQELVRVFQRDGFLLLPGVIAEDVVASIRSFLETSVDACLQSVLPELGLSGVDSLRSRLASILADDAQFGELSFATQQILTGHFSLEVRLSEKLRGIPQSKGLQRVLYTLLGTERLRMHMPPTARFVLPSNAGAGVPAHQDISYNEHLSNFLTCWTPFSKIDEECGGVVVHRGSGSAREVHPVVSGPGFWHEGVASSSFERVHVMAQPGDVLVLDPWVVHESKANRSERTRFSIDQRFFGGSDRSTKHYLDVASGEVIDGGITSEGV